MHSSLYTILSNGFEIRRGANPLTLPAAITCTAVEGSPGSLYSCLDAGRNVFMAGALHPALLDKSDDGAWGSRLSGVPVRKGDPEERRSIRSPSVAHSPLLTKLEQAPARHPSPTPAPSPASPSTVTGAIGDGLREVASGAKATCSAYYSSSPPAEPLRLVIFPTQETPKKFVSRERIRNRRRVRSLLRDVLAQLPLSRSPPGPPIPQELGKVPVDAATGSLSFCIVARAGGSRPRATSARTAAATTNAETFHGEAAADLGRSIAVQAHRTKAINLSKEYENIEKCKVRGGVGVAARGGGCEAGGAPEWMGGMRALRDSHVRLVMRQLQHIELLNRALDSATNAGAAPAAPASRASSASPLLTPTSSLTSTVPYHAV